MAVGACAGTMKPDANTGEDGRRDGAHRIKLKAVKDPAGNVSDRIEGVAKGVVTYPGGDRIDWRLIELPEGRSGELEVELKWKAPRPGLDLSFKVFDSEGTELEGESTRSKKRSRLNQKTAKLLDVAGEIFVKVYASDKGDAGDYRLRVAFVDKTPFSWGPCVEAAPEKENPHCAAIVARIEQEQAEKAARDAERKAEEAERLREERAEAKRRADELAEKDRLSKKEEAEKAKMCPNPLRPDPLDPRCREYLPPCDLEAIDLENPLCFEPGVEWPTTVKSVSKADGRTEIQINLGALDGIKAKWTGYLVDDLGIKVDKGDFVITRVYDKYSVAKLDAPEAKVKKSAKKVFVIPMIPVKEMEEAP
jgi:hypothetical protein